MELRDEPANESETGTTTTDRREPNLGTPSVERDGVPLYHALSGISLLSEPTCQDESEDFDTCPTNAAWRSALDLLIHLVGAERAFVFTPSVGEEDRGAFSQCLASRNIDGEELMQPEKKVSQSLLAAGAAAETALFAGADGNLIDSHDPEDPTTAVHAAAFPIDWRGQRLGILLVDNRFCALTINREAARLAQFHGGVLATMLELERVQRENRDLWVDVTRLREQGVRETTPPAGRPATAVVQDRSELEGDYSMIVGSSQRMIEIFRVLDRISSSTAPVLINGESGTGKELIAAAVHKNSPRRDKTFVSENCGALTETLLESELFGYVRGAFTGANKDHKGLFELAVGGTLFLDEVGDMSSGMQKKLLRVLQEGVIRRVGGKEYIEVDVRILSATNKDLLEEVQAGNFREDLYYRLNVINLKLPPLRERKEDVAAIVDHFMAELNATHGQEKTVAPETMQRMQDYDWPGNIRELQNEVRRMFAMGDEIIQIRDLSEAMLSEETPAFSLAKLEQDLGSLTLKEATECLEKEMIRMALDQCRGNKSLVAKVLRVPKTSLYNKINKYRLDEK